MKRRHVLVAGVLPVIYGCKSTPQAPSFYLDPFAKTIFLPTLGQVIEKNIGEQMIATLRVALVPALEVKENLLIDLPYSDRYRLTSTLGAGIFRLFAYDNAGGKYFRSASKPPLTYKALKNPKDSYEQGIVAGIHISSNGLTSIFIMYDGHGAPYETHAMPSIKYIETATEVDLPNENLQKELIYSGLSQSTITIKYREYWKGLSRPDYFQEIKYDLAQSRAVGFKEARFEILDATNTSIKYRTTFHLK